MAKVVTNILDGTKMQYTYSEMGTVRTSYADGLISFEWLAGPLAGESGEGFAYHAREVGEGRYFVSWHEPEVPGFVTLYIDFEAAQVYSSVLAAYSTADESIHFDIATIESASR